MHRALAAEVIIPHKSEHRRPSLPILAISTPREQQIIITGSKSRISCRVRRRQHQSGPLVSFALDETAIPATMTSSDENMKSANSSPPPGIIKAPKTPEVHYVILKFWCGQCRQCTQGRDIENDGCVSGCRQCEAAHDFVGGHSNERDFLKKYILPISQMFSYYVMTAYLNESIIDRIAASPTSIPGPILEDFDRVVTLANKRTRVANWRFLLENKLCIIKYRPLQAEEMRTKLEEKVKAKLNEVEEAEREEEEAKLEVEGAKLEVEEARLEMEAKLNEVEEAKLEVEAKQLELTLACDRKRKREDELSVVEKELRVFKRRHPGFSPMALH
ncbi:hypothetical protein B0T19DRAFT_444490 [Cercophora scortea]|uniref:Uncharacterized protein n=1 Tax=Cercophora scortea TaxID=314031 RepID=A0AAE0IAF0_9PEZI|nr:hypothetical protein B0T19DRAFT_444490 [Cercophora scortea]